MSAKGIFFLVAGPTAAGKTSVLKTLLERAKGLEKDISVTTRAPRPGEADGRDYRFWTRERFEQGLKQGDFLEHAVVHGKDFYGTLRGPIEARLDQGVDVIKDIDVQGVEQVRAAMPYPRSVAIFLAPPGPQELLDRFRTRGGESDEALQRRLASAKMEVRRIGEYDYLVWNEVIESAVEEIEAIRRAERARSEGRMQDAADAARTADAARRERREKAFRKAWQVND